FQQRKLLQRGVHVVVGTPGRIQDHLRRGTLQFDQIRMVVLDEADEMLRMGFIDDVEQILEHTPDNKQVVLFSATMPPAIQKIARRFLRDPVEIRIANKTTTVAAISQRYWQVSGTHKLDALTRILEAEDFDAMLIFVRTKTATVELAEKLEARGFSAAPLNGDMNQALRERTVDRLKKGALDIVVATDVAARGLDVERISHVLNYDIPNDTEAYVHRIGRTGRAGRTGTAILFVAPREQRMLRAIEQATRQPIEPMRLPSHADIADRRVAQFKQAIGEVIEAQDLTFFATLIEDYQRETDRSPTEIAAALAYLLQKDRPLLPLAPEPAPAAAARSERQVGRQAERPPRREAREPRPAAARPPRAEPAAALRAPKPGMERFRVEVGSEGGVQAKHLVGAIANEAGLDSQHIDNIRIQADHSTVDLPEGMPKEVLRHLQKTWVCGQPLRIHRLDEAAPPAGKPHRPRGEGTEPAKPSKRGDRPLGLSKSPGKSPKPARAGAAKPRKPRTP
ncbi:MAG: helicase-related protein, partial [Gammaproteobacteria bacterium]